MTNESTRNETPDNLPDNPDQEQQAAAQQGNEAAESSTTEQPQEAATENAAPVNDVPAAEETPAAEEAPAAEETQAAEKAPAAEETPAAEEAPAAEETPAAEEAPAAEETPASEEAPAAEETPAAEKAPAAEETPAAEEAPAAEETPAAEEAPAAEETPAAEEAPAAEQTPAAEQAAAAGEAPAAEESSAAEGTEGGDETTAAPRKKKMTDEEAQPVWDELKKAHEESDLLPFMISRGIPGGAIVNYKGLEGFVPRSQFLLSGRAEPSDIEPLVGQEVNLVVIEMTDFSKRKFVCSRKRALKKERMRELKKGSIVEGKVTSITSYGAFVDLGGVDGLIHISRLSKVRVNTPNEVVSMGENVKVRIVDINEKDERIALSMKEFTESPWAHAEETYTVGTTIKGKIRNITDFGVYVQLEPGIVGMVHISDLSWTKRIQHPTEVVKMGEEIEVRIMDIRPKDRRIALSLKDTQPDPWPRLANIYPTDTEADGVIKQVMEAGAIVSLDFDIDCFVPRGKMGGRRRRGQSAPTYNVGDAVRIKVVEMDTDKHSFIGAIVREDDGEPEPRERDSSSRSDFKMPRASATEGAFTLGEELDSLKALFNNTAAETAKPEAESADPAEAPAAEIAEAATQETPAATEETPAATEETPAATEETPAATEETPAATEETPAATEETPAATEETPAATEETPAADETEKPAEGSEDNPETPPTA